MENKKSWWTTLIFAAKRRLWSKWLMSSAYLLVFLFSLALPLRFHPFLPTVVFFPTVNRAGKVISRQSEERQTKWCSGLTSLNATRLMVETRPLSTTSLLSFPCSPLAFPYPNSLSINISAGKAVDWIWKRQGETIRIMNLAKSSSWKPLPKILLVSSRFYRVWSLAFCLKV